MKDKKLSSPSTSRQSSSHHDHPRVLNPGGGETKTPPTGSDSSISVNLSVWRKPCFSFCLCWSHSWSWNEKLAERLSQVHSRLGNVFILTRFTAGVEDQVWRGEVCLWSLLGNPFRAPLSKKSPSRTQSVTEEIRLLEATVKCCLSQRGEGWRMKDHP